MRVIDIIIKKRDGGALTRAEIDFVVAGVTADTMPEYQTSALLMAMLLRDMNAEETAWLTDAMVASGHRVDLSGIPGVKAGKHSTGGVGDKTSIVVAPLVAACGVAVPKSSGRGLGHTGGTIDKLESIPGFRVAMDRDAFFAALRRIGCVFIGQTPDIAPADKKLYALRDVTGTVESIPLIASSIMSKKIAEGTGALVVDVKVGSGAFMKSREPAAELARAMVWLGNDAGLRTVALLTDMSIPLGLTVGNALEVREAVEVLTGGGPPDVVELTIALAREMLAVSGRGDLDVAAILASGRAMDIWRAMITAQGGDPDADLPKAKESDVITAESCGVLTTLEARAVGEAAWHLGAGRARKEHPVQAGAGVELHVKPGDAVRAGQPIMTLHTDSPERFPRARAALDSSYQIGARAGERSPLILDRSA